MTGMRSHLPAPALVARALALWGLSARARGPRAFAPRAFAPRARAIVLGLVVGAALVAGLTARAQAAPRHPHRRAHHHHRRRRKTALPAPSPTPAPALPATDPRSLSLQAIPADPRWQSYVLDPPSSLVYPKAITVQGAGTVDNPNGLLAGGSGTTIHASGQGNPTLILDLGLDTGGKVEVGISKTDGTEVDLAYSEQRQYLSPQGDNDAGSLGNDDNPDGRTDAIQSSGPTQFVSPGIRGGERWISLTLHGPGTVTIDYVRVRVTGYRPSVSQYVGHFLSNDDVLNRIWYGGAYTFDLDSFRDIPLNTPMVVVDGAKRDRLVWLGDLGLEALTAAYTTDQAPQIVRNSIDMFSCQQYSNGYIAMASDIYVTCPAQPPPPNGPPPSTAQTNPLIRSGHLPEYTAWWDIAEYESLMYGGDGQRARTLLPVMRRTIGYMLSNIDSMGLFHTGTNDNVFPINWHPFDVASGDDAHTNATWVMALRDVADIERRVGDPAQANFDDSRAAALTDAMIAHLWDPSVGAFLLNTSDSMANHTQDGNVEAALAGVVTGTRATEALGWIEFHLETPLGPLNGQFANDPYMSQYISPYISSWELLARLQRHDGAAALDLTRRLYGYMVAHDPASTMWEKFGADGNPASYEPNQAGGNLVPTSAPVVAPGGTSLSHGWSTGPVSALSGYVLGLRPAAPGWSRWTVEPQPVDLRFAQGQAQTPHGPIVSRWQRGAGDATFRLTESAPAGTRGTVAIPLLGAPRTIARDGRIVWTGDHAAAGVSAMVAPGEIVFDEGPGAHTYAWGPVAATGSPGARCPRLAPPARRRRAAGHRRARTRAMRRRARRHRRRGTACQPRLSTIEKRAR